MASALLQNTQGLCYDSTTGACQKFHTVPFSSLISPTPWGLPDCRAQAVELIALRPRDAVLPSPALAPVKTDSFLCHPVNEQMTFPSCGMLHIPPESKKAYLVLWFLLRRKDATCKTSVFYFEGDIWHGLTPWVPKSFNELVSPWILIGCVSCFLEYIFLTMTSNIIIGLCWSN